MGDFYSKRCKDCYAKDRIGKERFKFSDRFFKYVKKTDGCWLWTGHTDSGGYGMIKRFGKMKKAHRISYELHVGKIPKGLFVCHRCDNPPCVNPTHIFIGTARENFIDAIEKGRVHQKSGSSHWRYMLTPTIREKIKTTYLQSNVSQTKLANTYGISQQLVSLIVNSPKVDN